MKKFVATSLAFVTLLVSLGEHTSAATKKSIFNRPMNLGCSVKYDMPSFSQASNSDENMSVFYSSQGKLTLQNPEGLAKNSYVSVNVALPRKERKWWAGFRKVNADLGENSFQLRVSEDKAPWWNIPGRIWNWLWKPGVFVKYALVLTTRDDEKILETPEVKEGQKKKEVLDAEKFRKEVEKYYGKDKVTEFKETYINKLLDGIKSDPNLDPYDPFNVAEAGHLDTLQAPLPAMDRNSYYTKKEADEVNKKIREDKAKILAKLAQKCGDELITEGEVAKLSQINKEQTFRLIVNNNIGEGGEADKLVLLLSNLAATGQSINDDSSVNFVSYVQSVLPDRFNNPLTEADRNNINRAYEALKAAKYKPGFFKWLWNGIKYITPDIIKDFIWWLQNSSTVPAQPVATIDNAVEAREKQIKELDNSVEAKEKQIKELDNKVAEANKQLDETKKKLEEIEKQSRIDTQNMQKQQELLNMQQQLYAMKQAQEVQLDNAQKALLSYQDALAKERQDLSKDQQSLQKAQKEFEQERSRGFWSRLFGSKPKVTENSALTPQQVTDLNNEINRLNIEKETKQKEIKQLEDAQKQKGQQDKELEERVKTNKKWLEDNEKQMAIARNRMEAYNAALIAQGQQPIFAPAPPLRRWYDPRTWF